MPTSSGSPGTGQRRGARRRSSTISAQQQVLPPVLDLLTSAPAALASPPVFHSTPFGSASTLTALARHRLNRHRDHDPPGMRVADTLRELDEENNILISALREPLPQVLPAENEGSLMDVTGDSVDAVRRSKRRKIDSDALAKPIPKYGYQGRVVPGRLQMRIESCGTGPYGGTLLSGSHGSAVSDVLEDNDLVFCAPSSKCNLTLKHYGETVASITKLVIKSPKCSDYDARLQEGLIFIAMDKEGLNHRTERYDILNETLDGCAPRDCSTRRRRNFFPSAASARVEGGHPDAIRAPPNRRHNSWHQDEEGTVGRSDAARIDVDQASAPRSPQIPYMPNYMGFSVRASADIEAESSSNSEDVEGPQPDEEEQLDSLDELFARISSSSHRMDDQRAPPPLRRRRTQREVPDARSSIFQEQTEGLSRELTPHNSVGGPYSARNVFNFSSDPTSDSTSSGEEDETEDANDSHHPWLPPIRSVLSEGLGMSDPNAAMLMGLGHLGAGGDAAENDGETVPVDDLLRHEIRLRRRWERQNERRSGRRSERTWRHRNGRKPLTEPRQIQWFPNKISREGLGTGPSGMPDIQTDGREGKSKQTRRSRNEGPLKPHARFFVHRDDKGVAVHFDPPVSGRYVFLKMWAPPGADSIDVQEISVYGYAGPRLFPRLQFL